MLFRLAASVLLLLAAPASIAAAQCSSGGSSCVTCHEAQRIHPVLDDGRAWHVDHAFGDLCVSCHGGERAAPEADAAHATMHEAMALERCLDCHDDASTRLATYAALPPAPPPAAGPPTPVAPAPTTHPVLLAVIATLTILLASALSRRDDSILTRVTGWLRAPRWTPHAAGALLGVTVAASYALRGRPIGISGAIDSLVGIVGQPLLGDGYWGHVVSVGIDERTLLVVGVFFGALISASQSGTWKIRWLPDRGWIERFGPARRTRILLAFVGAVLVQFGAGIAGGCTSGLAISGGALLSPAAFVFVAGMFAGGIPVAVLAVRRRKKAS